MVLRFFMVLPQKGTISEPFFATWTSSASISRPSPECSANRYIWASNTQLTRFHDRDLRTHEYVSQTPAFYLSPNYFLFRGLAAVLFFGLAKLRFLLFETTLRFFDLLSAVFRFLWSTSLPSPFLALPALTIFALAVFRCARLFFCAGLAWYDLYSRL